MATVVNNQAPSGTTEPAVVQNDRSGAGMIIGVVLAIVILFLLFAVVWPAMKGAGMRATQSTAPAASDGGNTTVNIPVPDQVDVNVKSDQGGQ